MAPEVRRRIREISGEMARGSVRNATPESDNVESKQIAPVVEHRAAKGRIEEVFLRQPPAEPLLLAWSSVIAPVFRTARLAVLGSRLFRCGAQRSVGAL